MTQKMNNTMVREMNDNELEKVNGGILCWITIMNLVAELAGLYD